MNTMNDTISVQDAAKHYGITRQAVYKKMKAAWKPYVVNQLSTDGKPQKRLYTALLEDFPVNQVDNGLHEVDSKVDRFTEKVDSEVDNHDNQVDKEFTPDQKPSENASEAVSAAFLIEEISFLRDQLKAKDKQIASLSESLKAEQIKSAKLTAMLPAYQEQPSDAGQSESITQPQDQPKGFLAWWHNFWNGTTPTK